MRYEVVEKSTGAKMAHTDTGQLMGTTLFKSSDEAEKWMRDIGLSVQTHAVTEAK